LKLSPEAVRQALVEIERKNRWKGTFETSEEDELRPKKQDQREEQS